MWELKREQDLDEWLTKPFCALPGELMEKFTVISLSDHKLQCKVYWHNIVPVPFRIYLNKPLGDLTCRLLISWLLLAGGEWLGRFAAEMPERGRFSKGRTLPVPPVLCGRYVHYRFRQYAMEGMFTTGSASTPWKVCSPPVPPVRHGRYVHYRFHQHAMEGMFTTSSASTLWKVCSLPVLPVRHWRYVHYRFRQHTMAGLLLRFQRHS